MHNIPIHTKDSLFQKYVGYKIKYNAISIAFPILCFFPIIVKLVTVDLDRKLQFFGSVRFPSFRALIKNSHSQSGIVVALQKKTKNSDSRSQAQ